MGENSTSFDKLVSDKPLLHSITNEAYEPEFSNICGAEKDPFYNPTGSWNSLDFDISLCAHKTILVWFPCAFFWIFVPIRLMQIYHKRGHAMPESVSILNITKKVMASLLIILAIIDLAFAITGIGIVQEVITIVDIADPVLRILTFGTLIGIVHFERKNGFITSWLQFFFWLFFLVCGGFGLYGYIIGYIQKIVPISLLTTYCITIACALTSFTLQFWAEPMPKYLSPSSEIGTTCGPIEQQCPKLSASFPSDLAFSWFTSFAWKGFKRSLTKEDLWDLPPDLTSRIIVPRFRRYWDPIVQKVLIHNASLNYEKDSSIPNRRNEHEINPDVTFNLKRNKSLELKSPGKGKSKKDVGSTKNQEQMAKIFPAAAKSFGPRFIGGSLLKLIHDLLIFIPPIILKRIIQFAKGGEEEEMWKGVVYALALLILATVQSIVLGRYFFDMYAVGIRIRSSITHAIYAKSLRISPSAKKDTTTGEVVNLMSVDVQRMVDLMPFFNMLWSAPFQIILCVVFLWNILGPSVLAGILVMILLIPLNAFIATKLKALQVQQMKEKDNRVKMMNEILQGIKILKLYAWEPSFQSSVSQIRDKEIRILQKMGYVGALTSFIWQWTPFFVSLVTFGTYVLSSPDHTLDAEKAFTALALFKILRFPLSNFPSTISSMVQASVSIKRIDRYLNSPELNENAVTKLNSSSKNSDVLNNHTSIVKNLSSSNEMAVKMIDTSYKWSNDDPKLCLENISFEIPKRSLVAVVGQVGSGKSSLLSAILGEMEPVVSENTSNVRNSPVIVDGSVAYAAQQAWIQNASVKDNILFGKGMDKTRYQQVLDSCALEPDLDILSAGDETEIGEKGINLSGGQKQRVSLARAAYSDADIFLLDDPLSAVDSHVGKHIFKNVIGPDGMLAGKTRLLVTHGLTYLSQTDKIIVMKDGKISETGTYSELLDKKGDFAEFLIKYLSEEGKLENIVEEIDDEIMKDLEVVIGKEVIKEIKERRMSESKELSCSIRSLSSLTSIRKDSVSGSKQDIASNVVEKSSTPNGNVNADTKDKENGSNVQYGAEKTKTGKVSINVYIDYLQSMGILLSCACVLFYILNTAFSCSANFWLSKWSDDLDQNTSDIKKNGSIQSQNEIHAPEWYLAIYATLGLGQGLAVIFAGIFLFASTLNGANKLHHYMLRNILRSPMSFFETTQQGRILNRFGKDVDVLDTTMPRIIKAWIIDFLGVVSTFMIIAYTTPIFLLPITGILCAYFLAQKVYVATSRQLKRIESVSRSPIYSHFCETINGASTIRAFGLEKQFIRQSERMVDENQKANFPSLVSNRWLAIRLETFGNLIIFCAALLAVLKRDDLSPGLVGLSISYALAVTATLNCLIRMTSEVETNIVAVERLKEYTESKTEAEWENVETKPKENWPNKGHITVLDYSTKYRDDLDVVLKKVSFEVEGGKKVGIVGRTGAGKSSFTLALFRILEAEEGKIMIDGIDIASIGLHDLRSKITIIPQDPVLFSGSLRFNLDPFNTHTDEQVWNALKLAHLEEFVSTLNEGLQHVIVEGGENLSVGQRQLVCLARALLRKTKILVLDEATAAVDLKTDELIQKTIREEFSDCTIITIAHRLSTIMDYDSVLVLQNGKKAEYDSPDKLKTNTRGIFYQMCKDAGLVA